jgi:hypothetical protein
LVVAFFRTCLVAAQPAIRHQLLTLKKTRPAELDNREELRFRMTQSAF